MDHDQVSNSIGQFLCFDTTSLRETDSVLDVGGHGKVPQGP